MANVNPVNARSPERPGRFCIQGVIPVSRHGLTELPARLNQRAVQVQLGIHVQPSQKEPDSLRWYIVQRYFDAIPALATDLVSLNWPPVGQLNPFPGVLLGNIRATYENELCRLYCRDFRNAGLRSIRRGMCNGCQNERCSDYPNNSSSTSCLIHARPEHPKYDVTPTCQPPPRRRHEMAVTPRRRRPPAALHDAAQCPP